MRLSISQHQRIAALLCSRTSTRLSLLLPATSRTQSAGDYSEWCAGVDFRLGSTPVCSAVLEADNLCLSHWAAAVSRSASMSSVLPLHARGPPRARKGAAWRRGKRKINSSQTHTHDAEVKHRNYYNIHAHTHREKTVWIWPDYRACERGSGVGWGGAGG